MKFLIGTDAEHCNSCQSWSIKSIISDRSVTLERHPSKGVTARDDAFVAISGPAKTGGVLLNAERLVSLAQNALELAYQIDPGLVSRFEHKEPEEPEATTASDPDTVSTALTIRALSDRINANKMEIETIRSDMRSVMTYLSRMDDINRNLYRDMYTISAEVWAEEMGELDS